jgi:hypothetical protein
MGLERLTQTPIPIRTPQPQLLERRQLVLEWPETVRDKDSDLLVLTIAMDERGQVTTPVSPAESPDSIPFEIPNIYDTHNIFAIARLDLAGVEAYREDIRKPLRPGEPVTFRWSIRASAAGTYRGVVWLRLNLVPKAGGPVDEMLLLARPIEIHAVSVLGLPVDLARILGGVGLLLSMVLGYPFFQSRVEEWQKQRKRKGHPPAPTKTGAKEVRQPDEPT